MRDKFFEFRPAATDPGELPTEDRHRLGDPNSCALESLAQPAQSRQAAARRPWSMHTQDERGSPVEPDVQVERAADVLPRPGRRDLIEQRSDRGVTGAGSWSEPTGQWWRWCQSLGPSSRNFAGNIPSAGALSSCITYTSLGLAVLGCSGQGLPAARTDIPILIQSGRGK